MNSLCLEILLTPMSIGKKHLATVIDDSPIDFLGNAIVIAPISRFHVIDRNPKPSRRNRRRAAIGIAKNQNSIRFLSLEKVHRLSNDLADLLPEIRRLNIPP